MRMMNGRDDGGASPNGGETAGDNGVSIVRVLAAVIISALLTLGLPDGVRLGVLSALLFIAAFVATTAAVIANDRPFAPHLTRWDEAAAMMSLSMVVGWLAAALEAPPGG